MCPPFLLCPLSPQVYLLLLSLLLLPLPDQMLVGDLQISLTTLLLFLIVWNLQCPLP